MTSVCHALRSGLLQVISDQRAAAELSLAEVVLWAHALVEATGASAGQAAEVAK
jgi:hypothetical protein